QAERDRDREAVHQAAEGGAFLVHVQEDFAQCAVFVFTRADVDLVSPDGGLLGVALTFAGKWPMFAAADRERMSREFPGYGGDVVVLEGLDERLGADRVERLAQLRAVSIDRDALPAQVVREPVDTGDVLDLGG